MRNIKLIRPLVTFDLETTGLEGPAKDRIVQIAMIKTFPIGYEIPEGIEVNAKQIFNTIVDPEIDIPEEVSAIHGITNEIAKTFPTFHHIVKSILLFIHGCDIAGYNILRYDLPILKEHIDICRVKYKMDASLNLNGVAIVDAYLLYKSIRSLSLASAYWEFMGKDLVGAHTSIADTEATIEVLDALSHHQEHLGISKTGEHLGYSAAGDLWSPKNSFLGLNQPSAADLEAASGYERHKVVDLAGKFIRNDEGHITFNFGKNKGVHATDTKYLYWMIHNNFTIDTTDWASRIYNDVPLVMKVPEGFPAPVVPGNHE